MREYSTCTYMVQVPHTLPPPRPPRSRSGSSHVLHGPEPRTRKLLRSLLTLLDMYDRDPAQQHVEKSVEIVKAQLQLPVPLSAVLFTNWDTPRSPAPDFATGFLTLGCTNEQSIKSWNAEAGASTAPVPGTSVAPTASAAPASVPPPSLPASSRGPNRSSQADPIS
jgi:hypothetical protein